MSNEKRGFQGGIRVKPNAEGVAKEGDINIDENSKIKAQLNGITQEVITSDQVQDLKKKTIDGRSSTPVDDRSTIYIDATSATYDNSSSGLTSTDIQSAIDEVDGRVDTLETGLSDHINSGDTIPADFIESTVYNVGDKVKYTDGLNYVCIQQTSGTQNPTDGAYWRVVSHASVAISFDRTNIINNTQLDPAFTANEVQGIIDEIAVVLDDGETRLDSLENLSGVAKYSTDLGTFTGTTIDPNTSIKSALQALETKAEANTQAISADVQALSTHINDTSTHGISEGSFIVGTQETQTLRNKTIDVDENTIKGYPLNSGYKIPLSDLQGELDGGAWKNAPTGNVVGTTDSQPLSNKTITSSTFSGSIQNPSRLDIKKDTYANLETYAATASEGQLVFATDTKQTFVIKDGALSEFSGGEGGVSDNTLIPIDLSTLTNLSNDAHMSSNLSYSIDSNTLNINHLNNSNLWTNISGLSSKFMNKELELSLFFRSASAPSSTTITANGVVKTLENSDGTIYSSGKWSRQLPDREASEIVIPIGKRTTDSISVAIDSVTDLGHYTDATQLVKSTGSGAVAGSVENYNIPLGVGATIPYSSSFYNKTFVGLEAPGTGYLILRSSGTDVGDDESLITPGTGANSFLNADVYYSQIGDGIYEICVDETNGRGFLYNGSTVSAFSNIDVPVASLSSNLINSIGVVGVSSMVAHNGQILIAGTSLQYSNNTASFSSLQTNSSIASPNKIARDPISGLWYVSDVNGNVYELSTIGDSTPTLLDSFTFVEDITAYNGKLWVAHSSGVSVIEQGVTSGIAFGSQFYSVSFDARTRIIYATNSGNLYGCDYDDLSMVSLTPIGRGLSDRKVISTFGIKPSSDGAGSQVDKIYITEYGTDGFMAVHGSPTSQIVDAFIRIKEESDVVTFQQLANSSTGVQTITQGNFAIREINSQIGSSSSMSLSANQINLKRGEYLVEYKAQQYDGEGFIALQGTSAGTLTITNGESSNIIGNVSGTPIVGWHHCTALVDVDADEADIYFFHFADASEINSTNTGYAPRATPSVPIFEAKVTKL